MNLRLYRRFLKEVPHAEMWLRALIEAVEDSRRRGCDCTHIDIAKLEWIPDPANPAGLVNRHHVLHGSGCPVLRTEEASNA